MPNFKIENEPFSASPTGSQRSTPLNGTFLIFKPKNELLRIVILRLGEESSSATASETPAGFFAALPMNSLVCQVERSETSRVVSACDDDAGFFAQPQNDRRGIVHYHNHAAEPPVGWRS